MMSLLQIAVATNRMTTKSEAGVAASLGIIRVSIKSLSPNTLIACAQVSWQGVGGRGGEEDRLSPAILSACSQREGRRGE